jgi:aspartate/methionine/tyrosine aminotransferase
VGAVLIVDEVARGTLDHAGASVVTHPCFATGQVVAVGDASKALGMGGLRVGWLSCVRRELLVRAAGLKDLTSLANAVPTQVLAAIALEHHQVLTARVRAAATANLAVLTSWLASVGGGLQSPADGLVTFPSLPGRRGVRAFAARLRRDLDVSVVPGELFGHPRHLRLALGLPPADFGRGLARLAAALDAGP